MDPPLDCIKWMSVEVWQSFPRGILGFSSSFVEALFATPRCSNDHAGVATSLARQKSRGNVAVLEPCVIRPRSFRLTPRSPRWQWWGEELSQKKIALLTHATLKLLCREDPVALRGLTSWISRILGHWHVAPLRGQRHWVWRWGPVPAWRIHARRSIAWCTCSTRDLQQILQFC